MVLTSSSTEWKRLECVRSIGALTDLNIWKDLNLVAPKINLIIVQWDDVSNGQKDNRTENQRKKDRKENGFYTVSIPYSYWWVGDEISEGSDCQELRSRHSDVNGSKLNQELNF